MKMNDIVREVPDGAEFFGRARILRKRRMGKVCFCDVRFRENQIQIMLDSVLPNYLELAGLPLGSLIFLHGRKITTRAGEPSVQVVEARVESRFSGTVPDKHRGMNPAIRYRKRTEDFVCNADAFLFARKMSRIIRTVRTFLYGEGYQEFITGTLQETYEGGQAAAFSTDCHANGKTLYLSLTSELKLKRLLVAGFEKVFEIAQSFRNEGIDAIHSPEFSLLEIYGSDCDYWQMMDLLESMVESVVLACEEELRINARLNPKTKPVIIPYHRPFRRLAFKDAFELMIGDYSECDLNALSRRFPDLFNLSMTKFTWLMKVIEKFIVPDIIEPTFLTELPAGMSPFVRNKENDASISERAFFIAQKIFIADIYSDENNPSIVEKELTLQSINTGGVPNSEYLEALTLGAPQSAGIGLGLNRLFMLFLGDLPHNIKEAVLYPVV